jgi:hypothetical protein
MRQTKFSRCVLSLSILLLSSSAIAKPITPGNDATREAALITLEAQLRGAVAEKNSSIQVSRNDNFLIVSNNRFEIYIATEHDILFTPSSLFLTENSTSVARPQRSYNFAMLKNEVVKASFGYPDVPIGSWPYQALKILTPPSPFHGSIPRGVYGYRPTTRYEFAVAVARMHAMLTESESFDPQKVEKFKAFLAQDEKRQESLDALLYEFAPELIRLGIHYDASKNRYAGTHKYQYFRVSVSAQSAADSEFVEEIKKTVQDFAAGYLKLNAQ